MIQYNVSIKSPDAHFIQFEFEVNTSDMSNLKLQLPVWRPGRYELGYFAKNIRGFSVKNKKGNTISFEKSAHSTWVIKTGNNDAVVVSYEYYANELNAGSTYLDRTQLYINPVNCFFYLADDLDQGYSITFNLPKKYKIASSLNKKSPHILLAKDHWELFDSPLIASDNWQKKIYTVGKYKFHILFQGEVKPDWDVIIKDFEKFTKKQIQKFGGFPVKEYWFLVQMPSKRAYHGVEHEKSTVISLGPGYGLMTPVLYDQFLGICSHELYHTWNVKNIKPEEFSPYDFSKENYNKIGYVIEGVTTYMGDKMLWQSGVRDVTWFKMKLAAQFQRHIWNDGRWNHSVRDSSFDTWLDGYVAGVPGRKVSIYTEGALLSFILDAEILHKSKGRKSLDTVMKELYEQFGSSKSGYAETDFWKLVEKVHGSSLKSVYTNFHNKAVSYERKFKSALSKLGWKWMLDSTNSLRSNYGIIIAEEGTQILKIHPSSDAMKSGVGVGDRIMAVNDQVIHENLNDWVTYYDSSDSLDLLLDKNGKLFKCTVKKQRSLYPKFVIS